MQGLTRRHLHLQKPASNSSCSSRRVALHCRRVALHANDLQTQLSKYDRTMLQKTNEGLR